MEMNKWVCIVMLTILVYCHLLSLDFADRHDIMFNSSKSQLLQFSSCSNNINMKPVLQMRNGQNIPYVESCKHLGNEISTVNKKLLLIQNTKCDLNCRMNSLLADFSYCNCDTILCVI